MNGPEKSQPMTILLWAQFFHVRLQCCRAGWAVWCPNAWISVNSIGVFPPWEKPSSYWGTIDGNHHQWILMLYVYMYIYIYLLYMCACKKNVWIRNPLLQVFSPLFVLCCDMRLRAFQWGFVFWHPRFVHSGAISGVEHGLFVDGFPVEDGVFTCASR